MRTGIHPEYKEATITCSSCGTTWTTRSTKGDIRVELCSNCHPFYTGQQRMIDTAGQVERFRKRLEQADDNPRRKKAERRRKRQEARQRVRSQEQQLLAPEDEGTEADDSTASEAKS